MEEEEPSDLVFLSGYTIVFSYRRPIENNPTSVGATTKRLRVIHLVERLLPIGSYLSG